MNLVEQPDLVGRALAETWRDLGARGGLATWAPVWLDLAARAAAPDAGVTVRFSNHWGDLLGPRAEYLLTVTNADGVIRRCWRVGLAELEGVAHAVALGDGEDVGAVYLGCADPRVLGQAGKQSIDYFFVSYRAPASHASVHSQPFDAASGRFAGPTAGSSWANCVEVAAGDACSVLVGNPGRHPSAAPVRVRPMGGGRARDVQVALPPFSVRKVDLGPLPPGWYHVEVFVGAAYPHLLRRREGALVVRHL